MTPTDTLNQRIPQFKTVEEEAAFWDSQSTADFEDEWLAVQAEVARPLGRRFMLTVEFDEATFQALRAVARERRTTAGALVHEWRAEQLKETREESLGRSSGGQEWARSPFSLGREKGWG